MFDRALRKTHAVQDIKHIITARRYETLTVHAVLQEFQLSDCEWLMPHTPGALKQSRVSVTDSLKRRELLEEFFLWYFDSFLIPLLKVQLQPFSSYGPGRVDANTLRRPHSM